MQQLSAQQIIAQLGLQSHPEGGHYREVHRSPAAIGVPPGFPGPRCALTAIYFLLQAGDFSAWHRVRGEEAWVHLAGSALQLLVMEAGAVQSLTLAPLQHGGAPLHVVPAGALQAAECCGDWSLLACLVAPGFEFEDFELPDRSALLARYPDQADWIRRYTR